MLVRSIKPISGSPVIKVRCRPSFNYNSVFPTIENGASHLKYEGPGTIVRLFSTLGVSVI